MKELIQAIQNVQNEVSVIKTDSTNPMYQGKKYATLKQIKETIKPLLVKNNLVFISHFDYVHEQWGLLSSLIYAGKTEDGTEQKIEAFFPMEKIADPQQLGKLATYARRYNLTSLLDLCFEDDDDDDDGNSLVPQKTVVKTKPKAINL